jgi:hypothetical protein
MRPALRRAGLLASLFGLVLSWIVHGTEPTPRTTLFAAEIARLSEPGGTFDTDNLISNEASYLDVVPALSANQVRGGIYIGVGPDQNFTYIAGIRPTAAYIIDIRRDNLLLHLLFKALFDEARTRAEYLSLLTGRPSPLGLTNASVDDIAKHIDHSTPWPDAVEALRARLDRAIVAFGVPLSPTDLATIDRFHRTFIAEGLDLVFASHGRSQRQYYPASRYPTFRELLLAEDPHGIKRNYLASEEDFQFVKALHARDAIVPVVGDVSGPRALTSIGATVSARHERVSAFYISNVEFYLTRDGAFGSFLKNLAQLPRDDRSLMIRSIFGGGGSSATVVQPINQTLSDAARGRR